MNNIECLTRAIKDKWIPIVKGEKSNTGTDNCACCDQYWTDNEHTCEGCPISEDVGDNNCHGTPYFIYCALYTSYCGMKWNEFDHAYAKYDFDLMFDLKAAARMELDYLITLRDRLKSSI